MADTLEFSIHAQSESAARTKVAVRDFELTVDEPKDLGGTDQAPNPVELLLASYAGCLNVVAHLVAQERGIQLGGLRLQIKGSLNPGRLFGQADAPRAGYQTIQVVLQTGTQLSDAQRHAFLEEVKQRCPVNDNLSHSTPMEINLDHIITEAE